MAILFVGNAALAESFAFAVGSDALVVDSMPALLRAVDERPQETLVVIGPEEDLGVSLQFTEDNRLHRPTLGVVLTRRRVDVTVLSQALRAGVREVVNPEDLPALAEACRRSREVSRGLAGASTSAEPVAEARVITVFAAKGGCGKTTMATNLAVALAAGGTSRVCILDLDLAFGDVAIAMQLAPARTMIDAAAMLGSMDPTGVQSLLTRHSPGVDAILAPIHPGDAEKIAVPVVVELIRTLRTMFDFVVIDSPPAFTEHVLTAFDLSSSLVLLATLDIPALKNLRLTLDMLDVLGYPQSSWNVVLNRSDSKVGLTIADVERTLRVPIAAQVPSSRAVSASINRGVPIVLDEPNHPVSVAIRRFADERLRPQVEVAPEDVTAGRKARGKHGNCQLMFLRARSES